jgi:hypothetical protein
MALSHCAGVVALVLWHQDLHDIIGYVVFIVYIVFYEGTSPNLH